MSKNTLEQLFGSRTRVKIMRFVFRNESSIFDIKHLADRVQESVDDVRQEVQSLKDMGLIKTRK